MKTARFLLLAVFACILFQSPAKSQDITQIGRDRYGTEPIEVTAEVSPDNKIYINSALGLSGSLVIRAHDTDRAAFKYKKLLKVGSKSEAVDYARVIEVKLENTPQGARLMLQAPNPAPWSETDNSGMLEGELQLPSGSMLEIDAVYFDLDIKGPFRAVENHSSFGRIAVQGITESVNLMTSNRDIMAQDIAGDITIATSHADIRINNVNTGKQAAYIKNENGNIILDNAEGAFDIKNDFGRIKIDDIRFNSDRSRLIGSYSLISVEIAEINEGSLTIRNTNEDIYMSVPKSISADFSLRVDSNGEINTEDFNVRPTLVDNDRLDFISGDATAKIRASIRGNGNIKVQGF